jgi:hypothetical protein
MYILETTPVKIRAPWIVGSFVAATLLLTACATSPTPHSTLSPTPSPTPSTLGAGFYDPAAPPAPEDTITPAPNSWGGAHPPAGYGAILLTYAHEDAQSDTLVKAVRSWAADEGVTLNSVVATSPADLLPSVDRAIARKSDLIISVGNSLVDPLAAVSPSYLHQNFLVVGAEIAEPTYNVTAADWTGAGYRGEGLGTPTQYDPKTFTEERAGRAVRAGVASIVNNLTGIVIWID